jgi:predicted RND superfamily exporter protein
MLFKEAELIAKDDLSKILPITAVILLAIMWLFFRDIKTTLMTLGSVVLVVLAVIGFLQLFDYQFSVIDGIAVPIIMGVAVDGAFWYKSSNKPTKEVREILLLAMATTVAAVSLALFSPIKAQRGLALVMIIGIVFDWLLTRFVLEEYYLKSRVSPIVNDVLKFFPENNIKWGWPVALLALVMIAVTSPTGVEALDINQFLPEDSESLDELSELRDLYVIASSTIVFITFDLDNADSLELSNLDNFKQQFVQHPNIIAYDTGLSREILVLGLGDLTESSSFDELYDNTTESILVKDPWLRVDGEVTGGFILAVIDGENAQSAYQFSLDTQNLLDDNNLSGEIGGDLITGISLAKSFEQTRILQIIFAGIVVFTISRAMTGSTNRAARIAVGTIAVGIAVDGLASHLGGRGVNTAPAVLLGMGFAADYLSHASDKITSWKFDNMARWGAAITSCSVFFVVSFSKFPPAKDTGVLLTLTIIISVFLATLLSTVSHVGAIKRQEE